MQKGQTYANIYYRHTYTYDPFLQSTCSLSVRLTLILGRRNLHIINKFGNSATSVLEKRVLYSHQMDYKQNKKDVTLQISIFHFSKDSANNQQYFIDLLINFSDNFTVFQCYFP